MTVRHLALELYRWMQRLEALEKERAALGSTASLAEHTRLETQLLEAKKAVEHYRQLLEGQKEKPQM
jgi:hypothetical protein